MIDAAEADGRLREGGTVVEATAGNTGVGLALVASRKGYRTVLVVPDKMSREKILHARALGAEVIVTRSDIGKGHPDYYQDLALTITERTPGAFYANQFANPANPAAHEATTAPEILGEMGGDVDAVVVGVGSGGTLTGVGRYMRRASPKTQMVLADPAGSVLAPLVETGIMGEAGSWAVEGIGEDFVPPNCDLSLVGESLRDLRPGELRRCPRTSAEGRHPRRLVVRHAACRGAALLPRAAAPKRVVSFVCDSGAKYLSKVFNDAFMAQEGWFGRARPAPCATSSSTATTKAPTIFVSPNETVASAFARMRAADVSQLPVIEGDRVVGLVEESDLLDALVAAGETMAEVFRTPVGEVMVSRLETISADAPVAELLPLFRRGLVPLVMDGAKFLGLVTRIDLINHFRVRDR